MGWLGDTSEEVTLSPHCRLGKAQSGTGCMGEGSPPTSSTHQGWGPSRPLAPQLSSTDFLPTLSLCPQSLSVTVTPVRRTFHENHTHTGALERWLCGK